MSQTGEFIQWREKRREGWSETCYSGIRFNLDGYVVVVSKLSHGLRALPFKHRSNYQYIAEPIDLVVPDQLVNAARKALAADGEFQQQLPTFEALSPK